MQYNTKLALMRDRESNHSFISFSNLEFNLASKPVVQLFFGSQRFNFLVDSAFKRSLSAVSLRDFISESTLLFLCLISSISFTKDVSTGPSVHLTNSITQLQNSREPQGTLTSAVRLPTVIAHVFCFVASILNF